MAANIPADSLRATVTSSDVDIAAEGGAFLLVCLLKYQQAMKNSTMVMVVM